MKALLGKALDGHKLMHSKLIAVPIAKLPDHPFGADLATAMLFSVSDGTPEQQQEVFAIKAAADDKGGYTRAQMDKIRAIEGALAKVRGPENIPTTAIPPAVVAGLTAPGVTADAIKAHFGNSGLGPTDQPYDSFGGAT